MQEQAIERRETSNQPPELGCRHMVVDAHELLDTVNRRCLGRQHVVVGRQRQLQVHAQRLDEGRPRHLELRRPPCQLRDIHQTMLVALALSQRTSVKA